MFKKGDRVRLSVLGLNHFLNTVGPGVGVVFEDQRHNVSVRIIWPGDRDWRSFHQSFIEKVPDAE